MSESGASSVRRPADCPEARVWFETTQDQLGSVSSLPVDPQPWVPGARVVPNPREDLCRARSQAGLRAHRHEPQGNQQHPEHLSHLLDVRLPGLMNTVRLLSLGVLRSFFIEDPAPTLAGNEGAALRQIVDSDLITEVVVAPSPVQYQPTLGWNTQDPERQHAAPRR